MKKVMVLTSMRTGSTWLTFLVKNLLGARTGFATTLDEVENLWNHDIVIKAHRFTAKEVFKVHPDATIITSVRNPKGRNSSQFYFDAPYTEERLSKILRTSTNWGEQKQLNRMWKGYSTRRTPYGRNPKYIWTTFEWMKEDIWREARALSNFLEIGIKERALEYIVSMTQKECKKEGIIRKGKVGSWKEEIFKERLKVLDKYQEMYYNRIHEETNN